MISMVTDLGVRLVKERESNKQLVLKECLTPLKAHIDQLHKHYLTELDRFKGSLSEGTSQKDVERRIMVAFDEAVFTRTVIANQLRRCRSRTLGSIAMASRRTPSRRRW